MTLSLNCSYRSLLALRSTQVLYAMMQQFQWSRDAHRKILFDNFIEVPDGETIWKPGQGNDTESDGKSEEAGINDGKERQSDAKVRE